jgi:hypothetical protein
MQRLVADAFVADDWPDGTATNFAGHKDGRMGVPALHKHKKAESCESLQ